MPSLLVFLLTAAAALHVHLLADVTRHDARDSSCGTGSGSACPISGSITFKSTKPTNARYLGSQYLASATEIAGHTVTVAALNGTACSGSGSGTCCASCLSCGYATAYISFDQGAGNCTVQAFVSCDCNGVIQQWGIVEQTFVVHKASQSVSFTSAAPSGAAVGGTYSASATASPSGLAVTYSSSTPAVCSIDASSGQTAFVGPGTCTVNATQPGDADFLSTRASQSFSVVKGSQTLAFTSSVPSAQVGGQYIPTATSTAGLGVTISVDSAAASYCNISAGVVSFIAAGTCVLDANQAGTADYNAAPQVQQSFSVAKGSQVVVFTSPSPSSATVAGAQYVPAATSSAGLPVTITVDASAASVCSISGGSVSFQAVGTCALDANQAGNINYNASAQVQQVFTVAKGSQVLSFTSSAPSGAMVGGATYSPAATSTAGLPVTITVDSSSASVCVLSSGVVSFIGAGTCILDANQAGSVNYVAATQVKQVFVVGAGSQTVAFTSTAPTSASVGGATYTAAAASTAGLPVSITVDSSSVGVCSLTGSVVSFIAAGTCVLDANQAGNANYTAAAQALQAFVVAKGVQTVSFTSSPPSGAAVGGSSYVPTAGASSGLSVTITVDGPSAAVCSLSGGLVSFQAVGTCTLDANQAGSVNYNASAQVQQVFTVAKGSQVLSFTSSAPSGAVVGGASYSPTATTTAGLPVAISVDSNSVSVCVLSSGVVSFVGAGTCTLDANQNGTVNYSAATQVHQVFAVVKGSQSISFSTIAPSSASVGGIYTPSAVATSGLVVTVTVDATASSICSISSGVVSFLASGTCVLNANQGGSANYSAAAQAQQSFGVGLSAQTISFTSSVPSFAAVAGPTYVPTAVASSGLPVVFAIDATSSSFCTFSSGAVSFQRVGTCTVDANQPGNATYNAAPQVQQSFSVGRGNQTIVFTSTAPNPATVGGPTYTLAATASSGLPVTITVDGTAASLCSISNGVVSFLATGSCVLDANQAGSANYNAAIPVQQSFIVSKGSQALSFTTSSPGGAQVAGAGYTPNATSSVGLPVIITVDASATAFCSLSGGLVSFIAAGTCVLDANQAGSSNYNAGAQVQQSFTVFKGSQTLHFTSMAPTTAVVGGTSYSASAVSTSDLLVSISVDSSSARVCTISGGMVTFQGAGTCTLDANQAGNANYNAAGLVQQSFSVGRGNQMVGFTSVAPNAATVGGSTYSPTATATSGLLVNITVDASATGVCSMPGGGVVSFLATGTCVLDANQAGSTNYNAATQVQQTFTVGKGSQALSFTMSAPGGAQVGGVGYTVGALSTAGLPVAITIDASAATVCNISGAVVAFLTTGTCVLDANQAGSINYNSAPQVQQSFTVFKGSQTLHFTSTAPTMAMVGGTSYTAAAASSSGLLVSVSVDSSSASVCAISGGIVTFQGAGTCVLVANQAGNANYLVAVQVQQSLSVGPGSQSVGFTSPCPGSAYVGGSTYTPSAASSVGLAVTLTVDPVAQSVCTLLSGAVSFIAAGTCVLDANQPGNTNFVAASQVQQSCSVAKGPQSLVFTSPAPTSAQVGGSTYAPVVSSSAGLTVVITVDASASSVCSISGGVVSFTFVGTCILTANQPGNASYLPATQVQQSFGVGLQPQTVSFTSSAPLAAVVSGATYTPQANASSGLFVTITVDSSASAVCAIAGGVVLFRGCGTCILDANQGGNADYNPAPQSQQSFGVGPGSQTIVFVSAAPVPVVGGVPYQPIANASSGLAVVVVVDASASSVCGISGNNVVFTGAGTCTLDASQPGNANFNPAPQVQQSFAVGKGNQTVSFSTSAPAGAQVGGGCVPSAAASSGLPVTVSVDAIASAVCTVQNGVVSFIGTGTCVLDANQAGSANYVAAPQVQQSFVVSKGQQTASFTSVAPTNAQVGGGSYTVSGSSSSGLSVTIVVDASAVSVCSLVGNTVSFSGTGVCLLNLNQAGNANYNAAPQVQQTFFVSKGNQSVSFSSVAPTGAQVSGPQYVVFATSSAGLPVAITVNASSVNVCALSGSNVQFTSVGTCVLIANQNGNTNYLAATTSFQSFIVAKGSQVVIFTSAAPAGAAVNGTYVPTATASSGLPVTISIDAAASSVCSMTSGVVHFLAVGVCGLDATQMGNINYNASVQTQQLFGVGLLAQMIAFTSAAPASAVVGGSSYVPTANATSGLLVMFSVDVSASAVCVIAGGVVSFSAVGTCVLNANQPGNANFNAAVQVQQSFSVGRGTQILLFTSSAPVGAVVGGSTYTPTANSTAGLVVSISIDASSAAVCGLSSGIVSLIGAGTCLLDANQIGTTDYAAATQVQQLFIVGAGNQTVAFTSLAPTSASVGVTYVVTAASTAGLPVSITVNSSAAGVCELAGDVVSFVTAGTCVLNANQAGNANYTAAAQAQQTFSVFKADQTLQFTSAVPVAAVVGGTTYIPNVTASSGLVPLVTVDAAATVVCAISNGPVTFLAAGMCVLDANQAGDSNHNAALQAQQTFLVGPGSQTVSFASTAPTSAVVGGPSYLANASSSAGLAVIISVNASSASVCGITGTSVEFLTAGLCVLVANQEGNPNYLAAVAAVQAFNVGPGPQSVSFATVPPNSAVVGATYTVQARATSALPVSFSINPASSGICTVTGANVSMTTSGLCVLLATQSGNANYLAAPPVNQTFPVVASLVVSSAVLQNELLTCANQSACGVYAAGLFQSYFKEDANLSSRIAVVATQAGACPVFPWLSTCNVQSAADMVILNAERVANLASLLSLVSQLNQSCSSAACRSILQFVTSTYTPVAINAAGFCGSDTCTSFRVEGVSSGSCLRIRSCDNSSCANAALSQCAAGFDQTIVATQYLQLQLDTAAYAACTNPSCQVQTSNNVRTSFALWEYAVTARQALAAQVSNATALLALVQELNNAFMACMPSSCNSSLWLQIVVQKRAVNELLSLWLSSLTQVDVSCSTSACHVAVQSAIAQVRQEQYLTSDYLPLSVVVPGWVLYGLLLLCTCVIVLLGFIWQSLRGRLLFLSVVGVLFLLSCFRLAFWTIGYLGYGIEDVRFIVLDKLASLFFAWAILAFDFLWARAFVSEHTVSKGPKLALAAGAVVIGVVMLVVTIYYAVAESGTPVTLYYGNGPTDVAELLLAAFTVATCLGLLVFVGVAAAKVHSAFGAHKSETGRGRIIHVNVLLGMLVAMVLLLVCRLVIVVINDTNSTVTLGYAFLYGVGTILPEAACSAIMLGMALAALNQNARRTRAKAFPANPAYLSQGNELDTIEMRPPAQYDV